MPDGKAQDMHEKVEIQKMIKSRELFELNDYDA
jgi:hypothetical protein